MKNSLLNAKQLEYKILQKEIKGISPKLSTYKSLEDKIFKLAEELGYTKLKKVVKPNWDKNVQVLDHNHKTYGGPNLLTSGAKFKHKSNMYKGIYGQQSQ